MNILGINSGRAAPSHADPAGRRKLADGCAALLCDGEVACAAVEERSTRLRYAGGFARSLPVCLKQGGIPLGAVGAIGHTTCCDSPWRSADDIMDDMRESLGNGLSQADATALKSRVVPVDHHESHAMIAFVGSGFSKALTVVVDGMGNRLDADGRFVTDETWWRGAFQRHTCWISSWKNGRVHNEKIHEDAAGPDEIGIGEIYRSVTHFLGWPSYQYAGKTMALASYGNPQTFANARFIEFVPPCSVYVPVPNRHDDPQVQINAVLRTAGYGELNETGPATPDNPRLCDLASLVQSQLENALISSVSALADKHGLSCVAMGGGSAMNCVALGKLASARPDLRLYVPPAPSDTGLALGSALWLAYSSRSPVQESVAFKGLVSAALGPRYTDREITAAVAAFCDRHPDVAVTRFSREKDLVAKVVERLDAGKIVAWRQGRSEYGPRALGQTSILADPRRREMHAAVNFYKRRETFRPFAPSILAECVKDFFEPPVPSPFMSFAGTVLPEKRGAIPAVVHVDGTARYQSVSESTGRYYRLLQQWYKTSGSPVLLNTSFNISGEPMVETPVDALDAFGRSGLPALALADFYLERYPSKKG